MTEQANPCPLSLEDMRAAPLLLEAPLTYLPQIDTTTRQVLAALLMDIEEHRDGWHDPEKEPEGWLHAVFIAETLEALLNRTADHHRPPCWLK